MEEAVEEPDCVRSAPLRQVDLDAELQVAALDLSNVDLSGKDLSNRVFDRVNFIGADLTRADLANAVFDTVDLTCAKLVLVNGSGVKFLVSDLSGAKLNDSSFKSASFQFSTMAFTDLSHARFEDADVRDVDFTGAILVNTEIAGTRLGTSDFKFSDYRPADAPKGGQAQNVVGIDQVRLSKPEFAGLNQLQKAYEEAGLSASAADVGAVVARWDRYFDLYDNPPASFGAKAIHAGKEFLFGVIAADGSQPVRPFWILGIVILCFAAIFWIALMFAKNPYELIRYKISIGDDTRIPDGAMNALWPATLLALSNSLLIAAPKFSLLDGLMRIFGSEAPYRTGRWVRALGFVQPILTLVVLIGWYVARA
tara:strand:- start:127208 stop:128308 length:1101 start_codon:yes stop_codon:yes gene_type:complete